MTEQTYPGVAERVKAVVTDSIILIVLMITTTSIFSAFESIPDIARIAAFVFIFVLYDPIFTSSFGGTIGHMIFGIMVKRDSNQEKKIILPLAIIRFIIKSLLGWISLLTVSSNYKRKALHDLAVGSVVMYREENKN